MSSTAEKKSEGKLTLGQIIFRAGAISNWLVTAPAIIRPDLAAGMIGLVDPQIHYLYLLRIWAGMAFLWGILFWEISLDMRGNRRMIKYAWLEKCITAFSVTYAWRIGQFGEDWRCMVMVVLTDYIWIIPFFLYDLKYRGGADAKDAPFEAWHALRASTR